MRENDVRATYRFLGHKDETEIRVINPFRPGDVQSIFVYSEDAFVNVCRKFEGQYNVYVGINERHRGGTKTETVKNIDAIVFDIDPVRTKGLPSTQSELREAEKVGLAVCEYLKGSGKKPYLALSGNGYQVWLKVDIQPLDAEHNKKIEGVLKDIQRHMARTYGNERVKIDNIGDLARVIKVIGTKSVKAMTTDERPNRFSKWIEIPTEIKPHITWSMKILILAKTYQPAVIEQISEPEGRMSPTAILKLIASMSPKEQMVFRGIWKTDKWSFPSRSEAEYYFIYKLKLKGLSADDAWKVMDASKLSKWHTAKPAYRQTTISKAYRG